MYDRINTVLGLTLADTKETVYQTRLRKMSLDDPAEVKEKLCDKLSRYQMLLEREYELRSRLLRTHSLEQQCLSCCDCGKKLSSGRMTSPKVSRSKSESLKMSVGDQNTKYTLRKQLSVDNIQTSNAVQLRKMVAKEKFAKRRASLLSLEEDFKKATTYLQRARSVDTNNNSVLGACRVDEGVDTKVNRHLASLAEYNQSSSDTLYV